MNSITFPLSSAQMAIYLQYQQNPQSFAFNIPVKLTLAGDMNVARLAQVINKQAMRHSMLLTRIMLNERNQPMNVLVPTTLTLTTIDANQCMNELLQKPFNLSAEALIRFYVQPVSTEKTRLFIVHHHLMTDFLPLSFFEECLGLYESPNEISDANENFASPDYEQFVVNEKAYLASDHAKQDLQYWESVTSSQEPIDLNVFPSTTNPDLSGHDVFVSALNGSAYAELKQQARRLGVSLNAMFTSTLFLLIQQYTQQRTISIATICNNRFYSGKQNALGDYTNIVLLQQTIENSTLTNVILATWKAIVTSIKHGRYPHYELMKKNTQQLQIALVHHDMKKEIAANFEFDLCQQPDHPLMLEIIEQVDQAACLLKYKKSLFARGDVELMMKHYLQILNAMVSEPECLDNHLTLITEHEKHLLLQTTPAVQENNCLHQLFEQRSKDYVKQHALVQGQHSLSYTVLNERANQLARHIRHQYEKTFHHDLPANTLITHYFDRSIDAIVAMLAILKAGAAYLPLDINNPNARLLSIVQHSQSTIILTNQISCESLHAQIFDLKINIHTDANEINAHASDNLNISLTPDDTAYVIYTSGTTGNPNGVVIRHRGVCNLAQVQGTLFGITNNTRVIQFASLAFDASVSEIWCTLIQGGCLYFPTTHPLVGDELNQFITQHQIEVMTLPPSILSTLTPSAALRLKTLIVAGESSNKALLEQWVDKVDTLYNAYGPTEATVCATMHQYQSDDLVGNIGKALPGVKALVLNPQLRLNPIGVTGEIYLSGIGLAKEYLHHPELTAAKFIRSEATDGIETLYRTGDKGRYLADGSIEYRGRIDEQVKIRGFRVELEEIEHHLRINSSLKQAAVKFIHDNEEAKIVAFVVPTDASFAIDALKSSLASSLPAYMMPSHIQVMSELPLTNNGKIDKKNLRLEVNKSDYALTAIIHDTLDEATQTFIAICAEILKVDNSQVRLDVNFMEHGGTSLSILKLISRIKRSFNIALSIQSIFEAKTLQDIFMLAQPDRATTKLQTDHDLVSDIQTVFTASADIIASQVNVPQSILLTGATGFLGINLLIKLLALTPAKIYCLIRAATHAQALQKVKECFNHYTQEAWPEERVVILCGDIAQPAFGLANRIYDELAQQVDSIYHCAANVNHVYTYQMLRASNVQSTMEVIKLAMQHKIKRIHYISTIDTITSGDASFNSEAGPLSECKVKWGYIQSKWASEKILANTNLPVSIYRPGNITGHSITGFSNPDKNHALLLLKSCLQSGVAPELDSRMEMTPVDMLSAAIVNISLAMNAPLHAYYNLHNPHSISWREYIAIINAFGYSLREIPYARWKQDILAHLPESDPLAAFKQIYEDDEVAKLYLTPEEIKVSELQLILKRIKFSHVEDYATLVCTYLRFLSQSGFIEPATQRMSA